MSKKTEYLICDENKIVISDIYEKVNELIDKSVDFEECCNNARNGESWGVLLSGDYLYLTKDGSTPTAVPIPDPLPNPIETWMNHVHMQRIIFNGSPITAMFMDNALVYYGKIKLVLPQYTDTFSLKDFIESELEKIGIGGTGMIIEVENNLIQPTMNTGDLSKYSHVTFYNNGEITGTNSSSTALYAESPMELINNGWIKGAGGDGYDGVDGTGEGTHTVGNWEPRATWDDGNHNSGGTGNCKPDKWFYNRYWKVASGKKTVAWVGTMCSVQEYHNSETFSEWGDQGVSFLNSSNNRVRGVGVDDERPEYRKLQVVIESTVSVFSGKKGYGGTGASFNNPTPTNGTAGTNGRVVGSPGFDTVTGINNYFKASNGTDGGDGGDWGDPGDEGHIAGYAISGKVHLNAGGTLGYGDIIGDVV
jgi:hypothetical protein